ncbi:hypothetical protein FQN49_005063 [Arthroderma sp. PD_2]|nr:hypothetical protein FQN49_005063 [Arthroderma sp. PD_2]
MDFLSRSRLISYSPHPLTSFYATRSATLINPQSHQMIEDCFIARLPAHTVVPSPSSPTGKSHLSQLSDEELLARFTRGFFGGMIFATEKLILASGLDQTHPSAPGAETNNSSLQLPKSIWRVADIPTTTLLPFSSKLFGSFQVTHSQLADQTKAPTTPPAIENQPTQERYSYIDIGFGNGSFAGCHRLSVHRHNSADSCVGSNNPPDNQESDDVIEFRLSHFHCNPRGGKPNSLVTILNRFHQVYAKLLFTDALRLLC